MMNKSDIFRIVREQAKKITGTTNKSAKNAKTNQPQVIDGLAVEKDTSDLQYQDLQHLFRTQFPSVTRQLLGKRYNTVNKVSKFILPNGMEQAADELLELLADFASQLASTESVLSATGSRELQQLTTDVGRSHRAGFALKEVNKALAAMQGAFSGVTGLFGAAVDLPASVIFSLKTIYEIGHSYGFELNQEEDQKAVFFALSKIDLGLIAEKQALFLALRSLKGIFATGDISQISSFLDSNYSVDQFKNYLVDANGQYKWNGFQHLTKLKLLRFTLPVVGGAVGAFYNIRLIDEIAEQADEIFAKAREYLNQNKEEADISVLEAYYKQIEILEHQAQLLATASPLLVQSTANDSAEQQQDRKALAAQHIAENENIVDVKIVSKAATTASDVDTEKVIEDGLADLAAENLTQSGDPQPKIEGENPEIIEKTSKITQSDAENKDVKKPTVKRVRNSRTTPNKKS